MQTQHSIEPERPKRTGTTTITTTTAGGTDSSHRTAIPTPSLLLSSSSSSTIFDVDLTKLLPTITLNHDQPQIINGSSFTSTSSTTNTCSSTSSSSVSQNPTPPVSESIHHPDDTSSLPKSLLSLSESMSQSSLSIQTHALDALAYISSVELPKFSSSEPQTSDLKDTEDIQDPPEQEQDPQEEAEEEEEKEEEEEEEEEEDGSGRVRAYAKLEFPQHDFFIRKLSIVIGRRPPSQGSTEDQEVKPSDIDVDLGPIRAVSRKHVRVYFDWVYGRWALEVNGRNGCVLDGRWRAKGEIVFLRSRTKIQIAERIFYFILPQTEPPTIETKDCSLEEPIHQPNFDEPLDFGSDPDDETQPEASAEPEEVKKPPAKPAFELPSRSSRSTKPKSHTPKIVPTENQLGEDDSDQDEDLECESISEDRPSIVPPDIRNPVPVKVINKSKAKVDLEESDSGSDDIGKSDDEPRPPSPPRPRLDDRYQADMIDFNLMKSDSDSDSMTDEDEDLLLSSEAHHDGRLLPRKAPASKAPRKSNGTASKGPMTGGGKSRANQQRSGKSSTGGKVESVRNSKTEPVERSPKRGAGKGKGKGSGKGKEPAREPAVSPVIVKERNKIQCIAPVGAEIGTPTQKPPYTYASMIAQALAAQADEDGKMLVSEMCEWMAGVYPFYGTKQKGSDWQSAVRHNLNADKRFKRIDRTPTDGGKGNFWSLKSEEWKNFDGLELKRAKPEVVKKVTVIPAGPCKSISSLARTDSGNPTQQGSRLIDREPNTRVADLPVFASAGNSAGQLKTNYKPDIHPSLLGAGPLRSPSPPPPPPFRSPSPDPSPSPAPVETQSRPQPQAQSHFQSQSQQQPQSQSPLQQENKPHQVVNSSTPSAFKIVIEELPSSITKGSKESGYSNIRTTEELSKILQEDPPMYSSTNNRLILNPKIFKELKPKQIESLERLGSQMAVKILQKFIVEHFKERIKKNSNVCQTSSSSSKRKKEKGIDVGEESDQKKQKVN